MIFLTALLAALVSNYLCSQKKHNAQVQSLTGNCRCNPTETFEYKHCCHYVFFFLGDNCFMQVSKLKSISLVNMPRRLKCNKIDGVVHEEALTPAGWLSHKTEKTVSVLTSVMTIHYGGFKGKRKECSSQNKKCDLRIQITVSQMYNQSVMLVNEQAERHKSYKYSIQSSYNDNDNLKSTIATHNGILGLD